MHRHLLDAHRRVVIDPVEREDGEQAGVRPGAPAPATGVAELGPEQTRGVPIKPLVEVPQQKARARESVPIQDPGQHADLPDALVVAEAEVDVEDVEPPGAVVHVGAQAATGLERVAGEAVALVRDEREPRQAEIAVEPLREQPRRTENHAHPGRGRELGVLGREHLLQRDDVSIHFRQHVDDAGEPLLPVESAGPVDVVRHHAYPHHGRHSSSRASPTRLGN